ncbi:MAG: hypothetical protein ACRCVI_02720 [Mycoplasmoidaceae bacterium]
MNKKIKLSILGILMGGSILAITLPIVSCSSSAIALTPSFVSSETEIKNEIGTAFRLKALGEDSIGTTNDPIPKFKYDEAMKDKTITDVNEPLLKIILDNINFKSGEEAIASTDVIESVVISGSYPASGPVLINLSYKLKSGYALTSGSNNINNIQVGVYETPPPSVTEVNVINPPDIGSEVTLGGIFFKTQGTLQRNIQNFNTVAGQNTELNRLKSLTDTGEFWENMRNAGWKFQITNNGTTQDLAWNDVVKSITVTSEPIVQLYRIPALKFVINLKSEYLATNESNKNLTYNFRSIVINPAPSLI